MGPALAQERNLPALTKRDLRNQTKRAPLRLRERGSAEQDDSKVEVLAPVEEATGDPLVRIPSGAVTREARDVDAGTDVAQADQPGEPTAESSTGNTETTTLVVNVGSSAR